MAHMSRCHPLATHTTFIYSRTMNHPQLRVKGKRRLAKVRTRSWDGMYTIEYRDEAGNWHLGKGGRHA